MADDTKAAAPAEHKENSGLRLVLELGPLLVFFFANSYGERLGKWFPFLAELGGPIFIATGLFMAATILSLVVSKLLIGKLPLMPLISGVVVLGFGALSIWLQNDTFIKMKPTIVNSMFAIVLLGGLFFGKSLLGYVFNSAFQLDDEGWNKLTLRWGLFFIVLAVLNEVVWRNFTTDFWVAFKVWGTMPITILFTLSQMPLIMKHSLDNKAGTAKE
jgi:intracellular septation protein